MIWIHHLKSALTYEALGMVSTIHIIAVDYYYYDILPLNFLKQNFEKIKIFE
jgi:hypothetical protein